MRPILGLGVLVLVYGFPPFFFGGEADGPAPAPPAVEELMRSSLHGTTNGMEFWYQEEQGGFERYTGIDYRSLACQSCHVQPSSCASCHEASGDTPKDGKCLACHSRQRAEIARGFTDHHRDVVGMGCADCHSADDVHGDGIEHASMFQPGALDARCEDCHNDTVNPPGPPPVNDYHTAHGSDMECAACHVQSVVTCYNCHFDSEIAGAGKVAFGQFFNWKFLLKRGRGDGSAPKIDVGNFQSAVVGDTTAFVAMGPYYAHTIASNAITACGDCHDNEYVQEYNTTGHIVIATWDENTNSLVPNLKGKGIIPVPEDWDTAFVFDYATLDPGNPDNPAARDWIELLPTVEGRQMLFAEPLDALPE